MWRMGVRPSRRPPSATCVRSHNDPSKRATRLTIVARLAARPVTKFGGSKRLMPVDSTAGEGPVIWTYRMGTVEGSIVSDGPGMYIEGR